MKGDSGVTLTEQCASWKPRSLFVDLESKLSRKAIRRSHEAHVSHLAPSVVVTIGGVWVLIVVG